MKTTSAESIGFTAGGNGPESSVLAGRGRDVASLMRGTTSPGAWRYPEIKTGRVSTWLAIGISVSLHGAFMVGFNGKKATEAPVFQDTATEVAFAVPPPKEEDLSDNDIVDLGGESGEALAGVDVPALPDVLTTVNLGDFVQPFDAASLLPRTNVEGAKNMITIPGHARKGGAGGTASGLGQIFSISDLDRAPAPTYQPAMPVPPNLRAQAAGARVIVEFVVTVKGDVVDAHVIKTTNTEFDDLALKTVKRWKFKPGYRRGKTVATRMQQPISFTLSD